MHNLKKTITILLILASMTTIQAQTPQDALSVITTYAEDGNSVPTVADYVDMGMTEIDTHNIDAINNKIATLPQTAIDTAEKIQKLIDAHNLMIHAVLNVVTGFILQNVDLKVDASSVEIADATYAHGTTPTVTIPTLKVTASDGGAAVTYTLNGTTVAAGATVNAQAGKNTLVATVVELDGDKQSKTITKTFTETQESAPDSPTDFSGVSVNDDIPGIAGSLTGVITDPDGVASVDIVYSDGSTTSYSNGNINNEGSYATGTTYTITVTDNNGVIKTSTGTL